MPKGREYTYFLGFIHHSVIVVGKGKHRELSIDRVSR